MTERHRGNELLQIWIDWVLVEHTTRNPGHERLTVELELVVLERDLTGQEPGRELHGEVAIDGPVAVRLELQLAVAQPEPRAWHLRRQRDPLGDRPLHKL